MKLNYVDRDLVELNNSQVDSVVNMKDGKRMLEYWTVELDN